MPGSLGVIRNDGGKASVQQSTSKLMHFPWLKCRHFEPMPGVALGVVYRAGSRSEFSWHDSDEDRIGVLVYGMMVQSCPEPRIVTARDVLEEYRSFGFERWDRHEGAFVAVILDRTAGRLFLANDRLGVLPVYYGRSAGVFAFAPEAKGVLVNDSFEPRFSNEGLINFLSAGYCFGSGTLFQGVEVLEPCTLLSVDLESLSYSKKRMWKVVYDPAPEFRRRRDAEEALKGEILEGHRLALADEPRRVGLLLSGGWDSRGMLAALDALGRPPDVAESWGLTDQIPASDAFLARRLADSFHVPFHFYAYDTDTIVENARHWCYLSELANDNFGWFAEGAGGLAGLHERTSEALFVGDEIWGFHGIASNETQARAEVFPPALPANLGKILRADLVTKAHDMYESAILSVSRHCENQDFTERMAFLYLHGRAARYLFSLGYYREWATQLRRPFLANSVIEVVRRLPIQYRIWRNLYFSVLRRYFPLALSVPVAHVNSLPDFTYDTRYREPLRSYVLRLLDFDSMKKGALDEWLSREQFESLCDGFFSGPVRPVSRRPSIVVQWRTSIIKSRFMLLNEILSRKPRRSQVFSPRAGTTVNLLRRLALLQLLEGQLKDLGRPSREGPEENSVTRSQD